MKFRFSNSLENLGLKPEIDRWNDADLMQRLWDLDPTVWFDPPVDEVSDRLGWLNLPVTTLDDLDAIRAIADQAVAADVHDVVLCGMGGSSLAPEVFSSSMPRASGHPKVRILDTTHPDAIADLSHRLDHAATWFIVSSKSGGTLETRSFMEYFWEKVRQQSSTPGDQFIAITDPGSSLAATATQRDFRAVFLADPTVGGRYSALSHFGLVPAAIGGVDVESLLTAAAVVRARCMPDAPLGENPAMTIGTAMARAALMGRNKTRFVGGGAGAHFGSWAEQLIAESTGKNGTGIVPIDHGPERPGATDELTISVNDHDHPGADIAIVMDDPQDLAGAMFVMELATAIAGEILGIHPFDQPDVQRAKELANEAMAGGLTATVEPVAINRQDMVDLVRKTLDGGQGSYVSIQAYLAPTSDTQAALDHLANSVSDRTGLATTVGYGPRFLHSTGQLHKGGPPGGRYIQLVDEPTASIPVPGSSFTFNELIAAQAAGDRRALIDAGRELLAIDLGTTAHHGVSALANLIGGTS